MSVRFSVLLPTHNRAGLLRLAIASVLAQTEADFELLIAGDGCTDNTGDVVGEFRDPRIRWFDLPKAPHFGYANRNLALRQAKGEYIAYVTDDDLIFPDHLSLLAATLEKSRAEWVYGRPLWLNDEGLIVPFASNLFNSDELEFFLTEANHIPSTCVMHRRSCLDKYGYWPEDLPSAADWQYWIRIIEGGSRANFDCCPIPSTLHFNADWRKRPEQRAPQPRAALELFRKTGWWPATLKLPIKPRVPDQKVFYELMQGDGFVDHLRSDVTRAIDRLAWHMLNSRIA